MDDNELRERLEKLEKSMITLHEVVEKIRKYFLTIVIVSVVAFVIPLLGLFFAIPSFLSLYTGFDELLQ